MNPFIDEVLEAQVNITEGYQGACQVMFFGGKEEESAVFSCLKEARRAAAGALNPTVGGGYYLAIINETTEAATHESALHWLFPGVLATEQPLTESNQQQSIELTNDQINAMQIEADTMLSVFYSFERLQNYVRWGRGRADHIIGALYDRMMVAERRFPALVSEEACGQSEVVSHLSWVNAQVAEWSLDLTQKLDEFEIAQYRADHPVVSKCHDILVNWFCLPVRHF